MVFARKDGSQEQRPGGASLDLERKWCPTCRRELPPWHTVCKDDQTVLVRLADLPPDSGPAVPAHLLDDPDEPHPV